MQNTAKLQFEVIPSNPALPLELEIWFDQNKIFDALLKEQKLVDYDFLDSKDEHELRLILKNKTHIHTQIDESGNIVNDSFIEVKNVKFDDIDIGYVFNKLSTYTHDNNGHSKIITEQFFNRIGCNGTIILKFSTPIYLWLLENMQS